MTLYCQGQQRSNNVYQNTKHQGFTSQTTKLMTYIRNSNLDNEEEKSIELEDIVF